MAAMNFLPSRAWLAAVAALARSAGFQTCCITDFPIGGPVALAGALGRTCALRVWKPAIQQTWKSALRPVVSVRACVVLLAFAAAAAAATNVVEYDFAAMLQPVRLTAKWADTNFNIWCGTAVKNNDGNFTKRGYSLALWESADGFDWKLSEHPFVANPSTIRWADGHNEPLLARERPQVVFENGEPVALCCAGGGDKARDGSFNLQIPLKPAR